MYEKQNFTDGQVLTAEMLNHIEEGIEQNQQALDEKQPKGEYLTEAEVAEIKAELKSIYDEQLTSLEARIAALESAGGSGDGYIGTWLLNGEVDPRPIYDNGGVSAEEGPLFVFSFINDEGDEIACTYISSGDGGAELYFDRNMVYYDGDRWYVANARTITVTETPSDFIKAWLDDNGVKQN